MNTITISENEQKRSENVKVYSIFLIHNEVVQSLDPDTTYTVKAATGGSLVASQPLTVAGQALLLNSSKLNLPAGVYQIEVWAEKGNDRAIYPDKGTEKITINNNLQDLPNGTVTSLTLDNFVKQFNELVKQSGGGSGASVSIDTDARTITVGDKTLKVPNDVNLSKYATIDSLNDMSQSIEEDISKDIEEVKSTANLAFDTANAKLDPTALNDYATNASVDEKIKSVKTSSDIKKRPTAVRADLSDIQDPYFAFDNGAEIHFKNASVVSLTGAAGYGSGNQATQFKTDQQIDNVMSYLNGYLLLTSIQKAPASNFALYTRSNVVNPINDISQWNWEAMSMNKDRPVASANELKFVQAWYAVGLFTDKQIESLGVVKKGETN